MTIKKRSSITWLALGLSLFVLSGCFDIQKRIVWSPDGKFAAVLGDKGMYLCDADGKISDLLVPDVTTAAWFSDSRRIAFSQTQTFKSWNDVEDLLSPETRDRIKQDAQIVLEEFKAGRTLKQVSETITNLTDDQNSALGLYIKTIDGAQQILGTNWSVFQEIEYQLNALRIGAVTNGGIAPGSLLARETNKIEDIRVSPDQSVLAYAVGSDKGYYLKVVSSDGSAPVQLVAEQTSAFSDWSADGRSLLFIKAVGNPGKDDLSLGSLTRRRILNRNGQIELQEKPDELVGMLFHPYGKVRSLADGRIIFSSLDVHLPSTSADMPKQQQLYLLDPERPVTLTRLIPHGVQDIVPKELSLFEISPDEKRIALIDENAFVVFNVAAGTVDIVSNKTDLSDTVPVWRSANELCFITAPNTNLPKKTQVVLWNNNKIRVISSNWPAEIREKFLDK